MQTHYTLHFDGSITKNPGGTAAYGFILKRDGQVLENGHGVIGTGPRMSCNVAEFVALHEGMSCFIKHFTQSGLQTNPRLTVYGDSQLVIGMMGGLPGRQWKANPDKLYFSHYKKLTSHLERFNGRASWRKLLDSKQRVIGGYPCLQKPMYSVEYKWVPREQNQECDGLSKIDALPTRKPKKIKKLFVDTSFDSCFNN